MTTCQPDSALPPLRTLHLEQLVGDANGAGALFSPQWVFHAAAEPTHFFTFSGQN